TKDRDVSSTSWPLRDPLQPDLGAVADRGAAAVAHDRRAQQQRVLDQHLLDARAGRGGVLEAALEVALPLAVDEPLGAADARGDAAHLARRHPLARKVDGVELDAALLEEALGLAAVGALLGAPDLHVLEAVRAHFILSRSTGTPPIRCWSTISP